jgi:ketosteroid isomerase-like protein
MPSQERIEGLIERVERGEFLAAIEEYYGEDATMQENEQTPRAGREALLANERNVLRAFEKVRGHCVRPVLVSGDTAVIRWVFEFTARDGAAIRLDELALQRWQGDRIAEERFYYDPVQMRPRGER